MKMLTACFCVLIYIVGLNLFQTPTYQLPHDQFCYTAGDSQFVEITDEGQQYIIDLLNEATWREGTSNCVSDHVFYTKNQEIHYHADCGTFTDFTNQKRTTLLIEERSEVNRLLGVTQPNVAQGNTDQPSKKYKVTVDHPNMLINQLEPEYEAGEEVTVVLPMATDCWPDGYVNGVSQHVSWADSGFQYLDFTFVMPCEDVLLEVGYSGNWGRCYFPHLPHPDWLHSLVCEEG